MKREDVPLGKHLAIPTRDQEELHEGEHHHTCAVCQAAFRRLYADAAPAWGGQVLAVGDYVLLRAAERAEGEYDPGEWASIASIGVNTYTGEVWIHTFEHANQVFVASDVLEVAQS